MWRRGPDGTEEKGTSSTRRPRVRPQTDRPGGLSRSGPVPDHGGSHTPGYRSPLPSVSGQGGGRGSGSFSHREGGEDRRGTSV